MDQGQLVWTFILIGNAAALFILSAITSGGHSAMGDSASLSTSSQRPR
jgi:hypothetical protein